MKYDEALLMLAYFTLLGYVGYKLYGHIMMLG